MEQLFSAPIIPSNIMSSHSHHRQNPHHRWSNNWNVRMMGMMIIALFSLSAILTSLPAAAAEVVTVAVDDTQATTPETSLLPPTHDQIPGNCSQVKCPPVESCPEDSYRLPSLVEPVRQQGGVGNTCCPHSPSSGTTQNKCQCIPDLLCSPKECPQGLVAHVSKNATGKPGGCCPKFECLPSLLSGDTKSNHHQPHHHHHYHHQPQKLHGAPINFDSSLSGSIEDRDIDDDDEDDEDDDLDDDDDGRLSGEDLEAKPIQLGAEDDDGHCYHDGQVYKSGGSWTVQEDCSECFCDHGLVSCKPVTCDVPAECRVARAQPLSCCPVCDGCVSSSGKVYNMSEVWQEDSCTNCTCQGGRIQCHVSMCKHQHTCENPKHYPGECCPRCENEAIETSQNPAPMDKDSCPFRGCHRDISCPKGFRLDKAGCPTCECQKCQSLLGCKLACTHGLKVDKFGCPVCECSRGEDEVDQLNNLLSLSSSVSRNGDEIPSKDREDQRNLLGNPSGHRRYHDDDDHHDHDLYGYGYGSNEIKSTSSSKASSSAAASGAAAALFCAVDSDGVRRMDGEEWSDHCRRCVCRNGKEMCSLITCQVPKCEHPIFYPGDCCPRCPVEETSVSFSHVNVSVCLSTDGVERVEGETWTLSSCLTCTCHSGQVFCAAPDCPPTPCSSPKLVDCCLQCPSSNDDDDNTDDGNKDHSVTSLKTSNKNCLSDDSIKTYLDGDTWKVGSCQSCRCEDGQIQCFSAGKCPALECARPILAKNQCCPICLGPAPHKPAVQHVAGFEVHHGNHHDIHRHDNPSLIHNNGPTTTATTSRSGLEPHCAVLIACLLVVTILLSLYIVRQVCFHRRVSRRLIKKVPVGFHSSSSSSHSPSVTPDCCYKCDYSKYCDSGGGGCVIGVGGGSGTGGCASRSSSTNGSNGHLSSEQKPLFQNSSSHNNHHHHHLQNHHDDQHSVSSSSIPCSTPTPPPPQPVLTQSLLRDSDKV